ncbi:MAG: hypothetical protein HYY04_16110 [Chloroflexi bacterium]|nr:hypothetical protein [Chloroflexota bacterium]
MPAAGFVVLTLMFRQEGRRWTGECRELGTATYGRTLRQTHDELVELVELHLNALEQTGEREHFFRKHNITLYTGEAAPAEVIQLVPVDCEEFIHAHRVAVGKSA